MNKTELIMLQSLPLDIKIAKSKRRIQEWIDHYGEDKVYISESNKLRSAISFNETGNPISTKENKKEHGYGFCVDIAFYNVT